MTQKMYGALVASLGAVALMLAANETLAGSGPRGAFASPHPMFRPSVSPVFRHHRRNGVAPFWPATGGTFYGPSDGAPVVDGTQPVSGNLHYTYSYDVPWDWTHRYPLTLPSDRPYVPSCSTEPVTVPGRNGEQVVNVMRCY